MSTATKPSVLFVCVHNAGRSQMAAAYTHHLSGGAVEVLSAGSAPADQVNPSAVEAMAEEGIDIIAETPKILTTDAVQLFGGAGYTIDHPTGDYATIVKLFRVAMLAVVVVVVSTMFKTEREQLEHDRSAAGGLTAIKKQPLVPWFLWVFVFLVGINSLGFVPTEVGKGMNDLSRLCLVVAISALGIKTSFQELAKSGWKPFTLLVVETVWMAAFVLLAIYAREQGHF